MKNSPLLFLSNNNLDYTIMKASPSIIILISQAASSKISNTPARTIPDNNHRWKCRRCNQIEETETNLPPSNYNCPSAEEIHAWENFDIHNTEEL